MLGGGIEIIDLSDEDFGVWGMGALSGFNADLEKATGDTHNGKGTLRRRTAGARPAVRKRIEITAKKIKFFCGPGHSKSCKKGNTLKRSVEHT